jgi:hypothetical protein
MKTLLRIALGGAALLGASLLFVGCVAEGGGGYDDGGVYYGADTGPWFYGGGWLYGSRGYHERHDYHRGGDVYVSPPRVHHSSRPQSSTPHATSHPAPSRPANRDHQH